MNIDHVYQDPNMPIIELNIILLHEIVSVKWLIAIKYYKSCESMTYTHRFLARYNGMQGLCGVRLS